MKKTGKALALLLALLVVLSLGVTALADDATGSITVKYTLDKDGMKTEGVTYKAYKVFDVTKDITTTPATYTYTATTAMYTYLSTLSTTKSLGLTFEQDTSNSSKYVLTSPLTETAADALTKAIAEDETNFLAETGNSAVGSTGTPAKGKNYYTVTISGLETGYYYVDSQAGALVTIVTDSTDAEEVNAIIAEKSDVPKIVKSVYEDNTGDYRTSATVDVTDTVQYQLIVNIGNKSEVTKDYVITDNPPTGFTINSSSVVVTTYANKDGTGTATEWTIDTDYKVETQDDGSIKIILLVDDTANNVDGKLSDLSSYTDVYITYNAAITAVDSTTGTEQINVGTKGNFNTATLTNNGSNSVVPVYTYEIGGKSGEDDQPFTKVDGATLEPLSGIVFQLTKVENNTTYYAQVTEIGSGTYVYYVSGWVDTATDACDIKTDANGSIDVKGLDVGEYDLTETEAGNYNLLQGHIDVTITADGTVYYRLSTAASSVDPTTTITVPNNKGSELPSTGGIGTTIFYVIGGIMVAAALVLLITKKRMSGYQD